MNDAVDVRELAKQKPCHWKATFEVDIAYEINNEMVPEHRVEKPRPNTCWATYKLHWYDGDPNDVRFWKGREGLLELLMQTPSEDLPENKIDKMIKESFGDLGCPAQTSDEEVRKNLIDALAARVSYLQILGTDVTIYRQKRILIDDERVRVTHGTKDLVLFYDEFKMPDTLPKMTFGEAETILERPVPVR